ncbi:long-chain-fatty-acid--CoA ligase [Saccharopolyspora halophila]|uniref:Long-chain-fatty-acid--CoA ligase n=1 Tax=Saccharopolyspora halophila TaxID=405551 RepID=A0ABN3GQS2_9PSEU
MQTVTDLLLARADDERPGLRFEGCEWSWAQVVRASTEHAALLRDLRSPGRPFHVGLLLDNVPEFAFLLGGASLCGAVVVGLNTSRSPAGLARDVALSDCQAVITESAHADLLRHTEIATDRVLSIDDPSWPDLSTRGGDLDVAPAKPDDLLMLIFTSGTSGEPKAVRCTHAKIAGPGIMLARRFGLSAEDTAYLSMPLFHSNAIMAGWSVGLAAGAAVALRRRFSASAFIDDIRRFGATYANYVGKPLSYVMATPPRADDRDNPLRVVYGNEGSGPDVSGFGERFDCTVVDGFGSTEGGVAISSDPHRPPGSLGLLPDGVSILDPETAEPRPVARFDADGRPVNADEATGELVNTAGAGQFAGYYGDPEATEQRMRGGMYWSGDLAYRDANGYCYFAGRSSDWLRVDGENLGTGPIERVLNRHPDVVEAAVYAIPDPAVGDQIMAAIVPRDGAPDPRAFEEFLDSQPDLARKQYPRFVRIARSLPRTPTHKVRKRDLAAEALNCEDTIWTRAGGDSGYRLAAEAGGSAAAR